MVLALSLVLLTGHSHLQKEHPFIFFMLPHKGRLQKLYLKTDDPLGTKDDCGGSEMAALSLPLYGLCFLNTKKKRNMINICILVNKTYANSTSKWAISIYLTENETAPNVLFGFCLWLHHFLNYTWHEASVSQYFLFFSFCIWWKRLFLHDSLLKTDSPWM